LRRPTMGAAAAQYADVIILTDDNPRFEESSLIIADILKGIPLEKQGAVIIELSRAKAVARASSLARKGSVVALLGKGHERYFLIKGEKLEFDDFKELSLY
jgi:UDP-N-acetylmuramoyl-L-alanyl-D-glutamate--2,6-diaminopimelate ligase